MNYTRIHLPDKENNQERDEDGNIKGKKHNKATSLFNNCEEPSSSKIFKL